MFACCISDDIALMRHNCNDGRSSKGNANQLVTAAAPLVWRMVLLPAGHASQPLALRIRLAQRLD
jgi:hypothetical protein